LAKKVSSNSVSEWLTNPWAKLIGAFGAATLIGGAGFWLGSYKAEVNCNLNQMILRHEFQEKFQKEIGNCQKEQIEDYEQSIIEIKNIVTAISENQNAKKK
jgi:hypothetical protein